MASANFTRTNIRWFLAFLSGVVTLIALGSLGTKLLLIDVSKLSFDDRPFNDLTNALLELKVEQTKQVFDLGLLLLGALWALIIAKKDEANIVLSDRPEMIMFVCGNAMLLASLICHVTYVGQIRNALLLGGRLSDSIPDIFGSPLEAFFGAQVIFLAVGLTIAVLTLISAHRIKE
jgi:hypothetical protein